MFCVVYMFGVLRYIFYDFICFLDCYMFCVLCINLCVVVCSPVVLSSQLFVLCVFVVSLFYVCVCVLRVLCCLF